MSEFDQAAIKRMRVASHLLPDPGGDVVRNCLDEIERLRAELARLADAGTGYSQQTLDAVVNERQHLQAEVETLTQHRDNAHRVNEEQAAEIECLHRLLAKAYAVILPVNAQAEATQRLLDLIGDVLHSQEKSKEPYNATR